LFHWINLRKKEAGQGQRAKGKGQNTGRTQKAEGRDELLILILTLAEQNHFSLFTFNFSCGADCNFAYRFLAVLPFALCPLPFALWFLFYVN
jgi:hypothetical protein